MNDFLEELRGISVMPEDDILDHLELMLASIALIQERMKKINLPDDFMISPDGVTVLDSVSMRLQVIGESVRKLQRVDSDLLRRYPAIEWDKLARFRDLISHHYANVDYEIVYDICRTHLPRLKNVLQKMLSELPSTPI